jgi:hypothetical protein
VTPMIRMDGINARCGRRAGDARPGDRDGDKPTAPINAATSARVRPVQRVNATGGRAAHVTYELSAQHRTMDDDQIRRHAAADVITCSERNQRIMVRLPHGRWSILGALERERSATVLLSGSRDEWEAARRKHATSAASGSRSRRRAGRVVTTGRLRSRSAAGSTAEGAPTTRSAPQFTAAARGASGRRSTAQGGRLIDSGGCRPPGSRG